MDIMITVYGLYQVHKAFHVFVNFSLNKWFENVFFLGPVLLPLTHIPSQASSYSPLPAQ